MREGLLALNMESWVKVLLTLVVVGGMVFIVIPILQGKNPMQAVAMMVNTVTPGFVGTVTGGLF